MLVPFMYSLSFLISGQHRRESFKAFILIEKNVSIDVNLVNDIKTNVLQTTDCSFFMFSKSKNNRKKISLLIS